MPHDMKVYKYVIVGNGMIDKEKIITGMKILGMIKQPIPEFHYARDMKTAKEIAEKLEKWHDTVIIAKIVKVVR